jgi:hypothetical protein
MSESQQLLQALMAAALGIMGGGGAKVGWDKWRRGGKGGDADRIVEAIREEAKETRVTLGRLSGAINDLRVEVARSK